jgi:hypothetical protein
MVTILHVVILYGTIYRDINITVTGRATQRGLLYGLVQSTYGPYGLDQAVYGDAEYYTKVTLYMALDNICNANR